MSIDTAQLAARSSLQLQQLGEQGEFELKGWSLRICPLDPLFLAPHLGELGKHGATCFLPLASPLLEFRTSPDCPNYVQ